MVTADCPETSWCGFGFNENSAKMDGAESRPFSSHPFFFFCLQVRGLHEPGSLIGLAVCLPECPQACLPVCFCVCVCLSAICVSVCVCVCVFVCVYAPV